MTAREQLQAAVDALEYRGDEPYVRGQVISQLHDVAAALDALLADAVRAEEERDFHAESNRLNAEALLAEEDAHDATKARAVRAEEQRHTLRALLVVALASGDTELGGDGDVVMEAWSEARRRGWTATGQDFTGEWFVHATSEGIAALAAALSSSSAPGEAEGHRSGYCRDGNHAHCVSLQCKCACHEKDAGAQA